MMKEIISKTAIVLDAQKPTETYKVLFKEMYSSYNVEAQSETFNINSYKVIDEDTNELEFIKTHIREVDKASLDAISASLTIVSTDYTDVRSEQIVKGTVVIIDADGIFGLKSADLIIS